MQPSAPIKPVPRPLLYALAVLCIVLILLGVLFLADAAVGGIMRGTPLSSNLRWEIGGKGLFMAALGTVTLILAIKRLRNKPQ